MLRNIFEYKPQFRSLWTVVIEGSVLSKPELLIHEQKLYLRNKLILRTQVIVLQLI